jgi:hypothetical protein
VTKLKWESGNGFNWIGFDKICFLVCVSFLCRLR